MKKLATIVIGLIFLIGCSKTSEEITAQSTPQQLIAGLWNLHSRSGGWQPSSNFSAGEFTLNFSAATATVAVTTVSFPNSMSLPTGTYPYSIQNSAGVDYLYINNQNYGKLVLNSMQFEIDQNVAADGVRHIFKR